MRGKPGNLHLPCGEFHDDKGVVRHQTVPGRDLDGEEVRRGQDLPMEGEELRPPHAHLLPLRSGFHMVPTQDIAHGTLIDMMPQIRQGTLDPSIAPGAVLLGHAHDELFDLLSDPRAAKRAAVCAPIELLRDAVVIPPQEGVRRGHRRDLFEAFPAERMGERSKSAAFGIGEAKPAAAEVGFEDAVFRKEVRDDLLLMPLQPASNHGNQNVEDHRIHYRTVFPSPYEMSISEVAPSYILC